MIWNEEVDAYKTAIEVARKAGILVGPTTGTVLRVALKYADDNVGLAVVISPDDAYKYMSFFQPYVRDDGNPAV